MGDKVINPDKDSLSRVCLALSLTYLVDDKQIKTFAFRAVTFSRNLYVFIPVILKLWVESTAPLVVAIRTGWSPRFGSPV